MIIQSFSYLLYLLLLLFHCGYNWRPRCFNLSVSQIGPGRHSHYLSIRIWSGKHTWIITMWNFVGGLGVTLDKNGAVAEAYRRLYIWTCVLWVQWFLTGRTWAEFWLLLMFLSRSYLKSSCFGGELLVLNWVKLKVINGLIFFLDLYWVFLTLRFMCLTRWLFHIKSMIVYPLFKESINPLFIKPLVKLQFGWHKRVNNISISEAHGGWLGLCAKLEPLAIK